MSIISYKYNPNLPFVLADWKGNPHNGKRFFDPNKRFENKFQKALKWKLFSESNTKAKKKSTWWLSVSKNKLFLKQKKDCIVWLGHASFFIRLGGIEMITDPVFYRASGVLPRHSSLPCEVKDFENIEYVLLSHGHRDHCDKRSLKELAKQNNFELLTSLNASSITQKWIPENKFQEAGWFQSYQLKEKDFSITFLPTQHWSNRYFWDLNEVLWGSFMIQFKDTFIYFGGDSGYCDYPKQIQQIFPKIDYCMLGVGAYTPDYMMQDVHTNPSEAVRVSEDLKATNFIPMHYGTFDLADEPLGEPVEILNQLNAANKIKATLKIVDVGQPIWL